MPGTISNSTPLIHLAKIGQLHLLRDFFEEILVPQAVFDECITEGGDYEDSRIIAQADWIKPRTVNNVNLVKLLNAELDRGESEAIALSLEQNADLLLLDDNDARTRARLYGIRYTGTIGVLLRAKKSGQLQNLKETLTNLQATGFWLNPSLFKALLEEAGEK